MQEYKKKAVNTANTGIIVYSAFSVLVSGILLFLLVKQRNTEAVTVMKSVLAIAFIALPVSQYITLTKGYGKTVKMRLLPFALVPAAIYLFAEALLHAFLNIFPFERIMKNINFIDSAAFTDGIKSIISTVCALAIYLVLSKRIIEPYIELFFNNFSIQFSPQFKLKSKWWFAFVAEIIYGALTAVFGSGLLKTATIYFASNNVFNTIANIADNTLAFALMFFEIWLLFAFFKKAFSNIDEQTRKLFYPQIVVFYSVGILVNKLFFPITSAIGSRYNTSQIISDQAPVVAASGAVLGIASIVSLVLSIILMQKSLEAFEKNPNEPQI